MGKISIKAVLISGFVGALVSDLVDFSGIISKLNVLSGGAEIPKISLVTAFVLGFILVALTTAIIEYLRYVWRHKKV